MAQPWDPSKAPLQNGSPLMGGARGPPASQTSQVLLWHLLPILAYLKS